MTTQYHPGSKTLCLSALRVLLIICTRRLLYLQPHVSAVVDVVRPAVLALWEWRPGVQRPGVHSQQPSAGSPLQERPQLRVMRLLWGDGRLTPDRHRVQTCCATWNDTEGESRLPCSWSCCLNLLLTLLWSYSSSSLQSCFLPFHKFGHCEEFLIIFLHANLF